MHRYNISCGQSFITLFLWLILLFPTLGFALEFAADDVQIAGFDPSSRYIGFVLTDESGGGNEIWWVIELATGKAVCCYDLRRMSLEEGGMQAVYRARAQLRFADLKLTAGKDARTSMSGEELELPDGALRIEESKGGFAFKIKYMGAGGVSVIYHEDLSSLQRELGQAPGYVFGGGKISPDGKRLGMILQYYNGEQNIIPRQKLVILMLQHTQ